MLKYRYIGKEEHMLAGVSGKIKPGDVFPVTKAQAEGLERHGSDQYEPVLEEEIEDTKPVIVVDRKPMPKPTEEQKAAIKEVVAKSKGALPT